jgi:hypothetical protein
MFVLKYEEYKFCIVFSMFLNIFVEYHDINWIFYFLYRLKNKAKRLPGSKLSDVFLCGHCQVKNNQLQSMYNFPVTKIYTFN